MELQKIIIEQANALKEVGFPLEYEEIEYEEPWGGFNSYVSDKPILPTLELVAKFFRKEKGIHIVCYPYKIDPDEDTLLDGYHYNILDTKHNKFIEGYNYFQFEQALSAGIDKAIEILKNQNSQEC